jgi:hypothetical protein
MKHSIGPESIYIKKKEKGTVKTVSDPHMKHSFWTFLTQFLIKSTNSWIEPNADCSFFQAMKIISKGGVL